MKRRAIALLVLSPAWLIAQEDVLPVEVRRAEPAAPPPAAEVRRAEPVNPAEYPPVDVTDGTEAVRAGPTNIEDPARQAFARANAFYGQKMFDLAIPPYREFLASAPRGIDRQAALFRLGESLRSTNRQAEAESAYRQLLSEFNTGDFIGPTAYRLGEMQFAAKNYPAAALSFRISAHHVRDAKLRLAAKFFEGRSLEASGRRTEALAAYREVAEQREDNPYRERALFDLADADARAGLTESAARQFKQLAETAQNPQVRTGSMVKGGLLAIDQRDYNNARQLLQAAAAQQEQAQWRSAARAGLVRLAYESENYEEAAKSAAELLPLLPPEAQPEVLLLAANARRQLGQQAEALALYDKLSAEFPGSVAAKDAAFHRLVSLVAQGDERALGQIEAFLLNSPGDEERAKAELLKAEILFARDQFAEAAPLYEKASTERGTEKYRADAMYKLAWCRLQEKKYDEAIAALTRFVTLYPRHPQIAAAYAQRALAQLQTNEKSGALSDFEAIINRHPTAKEREDAMLQRALLLGNMQRPAEMSAAFERLLAEYPETKSAALANFWIGYTAAENKKYRESLEPLEKARQLDPKKYGERATLRLLLSHYYLKDQTAAGREAKKLGADKTPREVRLWLGQSAVESGDYDTAVEFLAPLAAAEPDDRDLQTALAEAQLRAGRPADARATLEKVLPKMHEQKAKAKTHLLLSEALVALNLGQEAKAQAEEAQRLQPEGRVNAEARLANGRALMVQDRYDDAARAFMAVSLLYDEKDLTPLALLLAEQAYQRAGNTNEAAQARAERERRYPDFQPPVSS